MQVPSYGDSNLYEHLPEFSVENDNPLFSESLENVEELAEQGVGTNIEGQQEVQSVVVIEQVDIVEVNFNESTEVASTFLNNLDVGIHQESSVENLENASEINSNADLDGAYDFVVKSQGAIAGVKNTTKVVAVLESISEICAGPESVSTQDLEKVENLLGEVCDILQAAEVVTSTSVLIYHVIKSPEKIRNMHADTLAIRDKESELTRSRSNSESMLGDELEAAKAHIAKLEKQISFLQEQRKIKAVDFSKTILKSAASSTEENLGLAGFIAGQAGAASNVTSGLAGAASAVGIIGGVVGMVGSGLSVHKEVRKADAIGMAMWEIEGDLNVSTLDENERALKEIRLQVLGEDFDTLSVSVAKDAALFVGSSTSLVSGACGVAVACGAGAAAGTVAACSGGISLVLGLGLGVGYLSYKGYKHRYDIQAGSEGLYHQGRVKYGEYQETSTKKTKEKTNEVIKASVEQFKQSGQRPKLKLVNNYLGTQWGIIDQSKARLKKLKMDVPQTKKYASVGQVVGHHEQQPQTVASLEKVIKRIDSDFSNVVLPQVKEAQRNGNTERERHYNTVISAMKLHRQVAVQELTIAQAEVKKAKAEEFREELQQQIVESSLQGRDNVKKSEKKLIQLDEGLLKIEQDLIVSRGKLQKLRDNADNVKLASRLRIKPEEAKRKIDDLIHRLENDPNSDQKMALMLHENGIDVSEWESDRRAPLMAYLLDSDYTPSWEREL